MRLSHALSHSLALSCFAAALLLGGALAQPAASFEPQVGQQGKDVVWVPTPQALVDKMLDIAKADSNDYVIDLGSGDGRTVITAAKRGIKALGIEYNHDMVALSKRNAEKEGVSDKASFIQADLFQTDFSQATVLTMFLLTDINLRLRPTILEMKPGTRVVSNTFEMGDWTPDETVQVSEGCTNYCKAYFWIVPAKVEGAWQTPQGELTLKQKYQMVSGTLKSGNAITPLTEGRIKGDQISFKAGAAQFSGRVNGNVIEGASKSGGNESPWRATRG